MTVEQKQHEMRPNWWQTFLNGDYLNKRPRRGDICNATILSKSDHDILVELDGKRDGVVPRKDLEQVNADYVTQLEVGDEIPVRVTKVPFNRSGILVSLKQGLYYQDWLRAQRLMEEEKVIDVEVVDTNRGGVLAKLGRLQGFIPNSHLTSIPRWLKHHQRQERKVELVDESLSVLVIEVNSRRRRLVLSERKAQQKLRVQLLADLHEGAICTGTVVNLTDFGAFVDLGGIDGLLHISEISWNPVEHPRDVFSVGDEIEVYVLDVDRERERIGLSRKRLLPQPWFSNDTT